MFIIFKRYFISGMTFEPVNNTLLMQLGQRQTFVVARWRFCIQEIGCNVRGLATGIIQSWVALMLFKYKQFSFVSSKLTCKFQHNHLKCATDLNYQCLFEWSIFNAIAVQTCVTSYKFKLFGALKTQINSKRKPSLPSFFFIQTKVHWTVTIM